MAGFANKGKAQILEIVYRGVAAPTNFYLALVTATTAPSADIDTLGQMSQIASGMGYTVGGYKLTPDDTDFDVLTEDDSNDRGLFQLKDIVWTADGGTLPRTGAGARYAILVDDAGSKVFNYWDLVSDRQVSDGQTLTLEDAEGRLNES